MLNLHWEGSYLLMKLLTEIEYETLKFQIKVLTVVYNIFKK